jgi:hypothetical protein
LRARDATVWRYDALVQSVYSVIGVLAALNQLHFSTFEFKRASKFVSRLEVAPPDLAARLNALFASDERRSTEELERIVAETQALIAERFPDLDLSLEWGGKPTAPGSGRPRGPGNKSLQSARRTARNRSHGPGATYVC